MRSTDQGPAPGRERLPQRATVEDAVISSVDWLVEPCWKGTRVLASFRDGRVTLTDGDGAPPGPELDEAATVIAAAIDADQALLDGAWTGMPFSSARRRQQRRARAVVVPSDGPGSDLAERDSRRAFVAWDLLELDGASLRDVPLQERRRLLESVLVDSVRARVTPAVRVPIEPWLAAWRADGFTRIVAKHVNSRYRNGETAEDWLEIGIDANAGSVGLRGLFGRRRPIRRIGD